MSEDDYAPWRMREELEFIDLLPTWRLAPYREGLLKRVKFDHLNREVLLKRVDRRIAAFERRSREP